METIHRNFIKESEREFVESWMQKLFDEDKLLQNPTDSTRYSVRLQPADPDNTFPGEWNRATESIPLPSEIHAIKQRLMDRFQIGKWEDENNKDVLLNYFLDKAKLEFHRHIKGSNRRHEEFVEMRCNILISKPTAGGDLLVENRIITLRERGLVLFNALLPHGTTTVEGGVRMVLSFGFDLPEFEFNRCIFQKMKERPKLL